MRGLRLIAILLALFAAPALAQTSAQTAAISDDELIDGFGVVVRGLNLSRVCRVYGEDLNREFGSYVANVKAAVDARITESREDAVIEAAVREARLSLCPPYVRDDVEQAYFLAQRLTATLYPNGDDPQGTARFRIRDGYVVWGRAVATDARCDHLGDDDRAFLGHAYARMKTLMAKAWTAKDIATFDARMKDDQPCGAATEQSVKSAVAAARLALKDADPAEGAGPAGGAGPADAAEFVGPAQHTAPAPVSGDAPLRDDSVGPEPGPVP
ncbi:MAG: hypothetical protein ACM30I_15660 [Gemmatimonas sp.]